MKERFSIVNVIIIIEFLIILGLIFGVLRKEDRLLEQLQQPNSVSDASVASPRAGTPELAPVKTHAAAIKQIEDDAGMVLSRIAKLIIRDEGKRERPYLDPTGEVTIGVGRSLGTNGISVAELQAIVDDIDYSVVLARTHVTNGRIRINSLELAEKIFKKPLTEHDIQLLLADDLNNVRKEAERVFRETWQRLDAVRKEVIVDVLFNLGLPHFREFKKFIAAVKVQHWQQAAAELLLSNAARENITRYHRNATVLQTGDAKYFDL